LLNSSFECDNGSLISACRQSIVFMSQDDQSKKIQAQLDRVKSGIQKTLELANRSNTSENSEDYEFLEVQLDQTEADAREAFQAKLDCRSLLSKLTSGDALTTDDLKTLELLIVGDAESYLKYESEVAEWKAQLKRVLDQIAALQNSTFDGETLMQLRALCREAHEAIADLIFYFDAKERVTKFREATHGSIDPKGYRFLASMVREMLASDKM
jgi:hypothetical protein